MHIPALVIIDKSVPSEHLYFEIEEVLKPYSPDLKVKKHAVLSRAEYIAFTRQAYKKELVEFEALAKNPTEEFYRMYPAPSDVRRRREVLEVFSSIASDEAVWALILSRHHESEFDAEGNLLGTDNPNTKFSSWERGGIYEHAILNTDGRRDSNGGLITKGFDTMRRKDLRTMASVGVLVAKDGIWVEPYDLPIPPEERGEANNVLARFDDFVFKSISEADREDWLLIVDILSEDDD